MAFARFQAPPHLVSATGAHVRRQGVHGGLTSTQHVQASPWELGLLQPCSSSSRKQSQHLSTSHLSGTSSIVDISQTAPRTKPAAFRLFPFSEADVPGPNNRDKPKSIQCPCINEIMQEPKARHLPCSVPPVQQLKIFPKQINQVRNEATLQPTTQTPHQPSPGLQQPPLPNTAETANPVVFSRVS